MREQQDYIVRITDVIQKNRTYLARIDKDDTSKQVKVTSNIFIATLRLETAKNNIATLDQEVAAKAAAMMEALRIANGERGSWLF